MDLTLDAPKRVPIQQFRMEKGRKRRRMSCFMSTVVNLAQLEWEEGRADSSRGEMRDREKQLSVGTNLAAAVEDIGDDDGGEEK